MEEKKIINNFFDCDYRNIEFSGDIINNVIYKNCKFHNCIFNDNFYNKNEFKNCFFDKCDFYNSIEEKIYIKEQKPKIFNCSPIINLKTDYIIKPKEIIDIANDIKITLKEFEELRDETENGKQLMGVYFEYFAKEYFIFNYPNYTFYLYDEIPKKIKKKFNLSNNDFGIDIIGKPKKNDYYLFIQVKYRGEGYINYSTLGTFYGQCLRNISKKIKPIIFTSALIFHSEIIKFYKTDIINIIDFNNIKKYISENNIVLSNCFKEYDKVINNKTIKNYVKKISNNNYEFNTSECYCKI